MATMTISYDGRNRTARALVDMIRSLDIFSITESPCKSAPTRMAKDEKHRLVYEIRNNEIIVLALAAYGHYGDRKNRQEQNGRWILN